MISRYPYVFFDLDGTLSESGPGVKACIEMTLDDMGLERADLSDYSRFVGPPLVNTFNGLCNINDMKTAYEAVKIYSAHYKKEGMKFNRLYNGLDDLLKDLHKCAKGLAVCTSKDQTLAQDVLDLIGIRQYFDIVIGSFPDGRRKNKCESVEYALEYFHVCENKKADAVLIGDSVFDLKGARKAGSDFIGVCYGYGKKEDMRALGADKLADSVSELRGFLISE